MFGASLTGGTTAAALPSGYSYPGPSQNTLPLLPGYNFSNLKRPAHYHRTQTLDKANGVNVIKDVGRKFNEMLPSAQKISTADIAVAHPDWLTLDNKSLRFFGYFLESTHESPHESARVRRCTIYYFLEDDTLQVVEPKQDNSGIPQGKFVARHKVPKTMGGEDYYTLDDLDIGKDLAVYGKVFHIVDCDAFTRYFYSQLGRSLKPMEDYPQDQYDDKLQTTKAATDPKRARDPGDYELKRYFEYAAGGRLNLSNNAEKELAKGFLENDRKVLRFHAFWDNRNTVHGDKRKFVVLYFLADQTVKVLESNSANDGRDPFPVFIKRHRITKVTCPASDENLETMSSEKKATIGLDDLRVGNVVNFYGRDLVLYDCDELTRRYMLENFGVASDSFDPTEPAPEKKTFKVPPHRGFGSPEDSLVSCKHLVLKAPKKDVIKMQEMNGKTLRFGGYLATQAERRFIVCYYLADDTVAIFEQPGKNTGFVGGKFLSRRRVKIPMPGNATLANEAPYYQGSDFYVGAEVNINGYRIVLDKTDEATVKYLDGTEKEITVESLNAMMAKIRSNILVRFAKLTDAFRALDRDHDGQIDISEFTRTCKEMNLDLDDKELLALINYMDVNKDGSVDYAEFVRMMAPKDYEGELDTGKGIEPLTHIPVGKQAESYKRNAHSRSVMALSDKVFKRFRDKLRAQRFVNLDLFRIMSERSYDSLIGANEFQSAVKRLLQLELNEEEMGMLTRRFFPYENKRLTVKDFTRVIESAPHFETTYI